MISDTRYFGHAHAQTLTASIAPLHPWWARLYQFRTSGTHEVELPDPSEYASKIKPGRAAFTIVNDSNAGSNVVEVWDHEANVVASLDVGEAVDIHLGWTGRTDASEGAYVWCARMRARLS